LARIGAVIHLKEQKMKLREIFGASALALLAGIAYAQSASTGGASMNSSGTAQALPAVTMPATTSNDPLVQKRMEDKAAKKEYKATKKAAKRELKQEKKQSKAELQQQLQAEPKPPGAVGQPGVYGQPPLGTPPGK
jgi:flagellar biosynthesis GTPase FlhF